MPFSKPCGYQPPTQYLMPGSFSTSEIMDKLPRGIRNNNPLNIRIGNGWVGECEENTDGSFEQFVCIHYGLRAGFVLLRRYIERYKLNTIAKIISRWAPSSENNTKKYIKSVAHLTGIDENKVIQFNDKKEMCNLVHAMVCVECATNIPIMDIEAGYALATN